LWVGRRPLCHEIPADCRWVVDLTAEFWTARGVCGNGDGARRYLCRPVLDGHVADVRTFVQTVREVAALDGGLYVHCAQGHARSAALAAAIMIARGLADDVDDAERKMVLARAGICLKENQRALVRRITPALREVRSERT
jgi:protein-tyrosine phosphatase